MDLKTSEWDISSYLSSAEDISAYLNAVIEDGDSALLQAAIGDIAKALGMGKVAKEVGVGRESLYKSLDASGNPSFRTMLGVSRALGLRIVFEPISQQEKADQAGNYAKIAVR